MEFWNKAVEIMKTMPPIVHNIFPFIFSALAYFLNILIGFLLRCNWAHWSEMSREEKEKEIAKILWSKHGVRAIEHAGIAFVVAIIFIQFC